MLKSTICSNCIHRYAPTPKGAILHDNAQILPLIFHNQNIVEARLPIQWAPQIMPPLLFHNFWYTRQWICILCGYSIYMVEVGTEFVLLSFLLTLNQDSTTRTSNILWVRNNPKSYKFSHLALDPGLLLRWIKTWLGLYLCANQYLGVKSIIPNASHIMLPNSQIGLYF